MCCTSAVAHMYVVWSCSTLFLPSVSVLIRSYEVTKEIATGPTYPGKDKAVFEFTRTYSRLECAIHILLGIYSCVVRGLLSLGSCFVPTTVRFPRVSERYFLSFPRPQDTHTHVPRSRFRFARENRKSS